MCPNVFYVLDDISDDTPDSKTIVRFDAIISGQITTVSIRKNSTRTLGIMVNSETRTNAVLTSAVNQTISGTKTFATLPESSVVPTTDNQLVNKKYVDDNAGGGGSSMYLGKFSDFNSTSSYLDLTTLEVGSYRIIDDDNTNYLYFGNKSSNKIYNPTKQGNGSYSHIVGDMYLILTKKINDVTGSSYEEVGNFYAFEFTTQLYQSWDNTIKLYRYKILYSATSGYYIDSYSYGYRCMGLDDAQTVTGLKTFTTLPESSVAPSSNNQFANKKYVDDAIAAAIANL